MLHSGGAVVVAGIPSAPVYVIDDQISEVAGRAGSCSLNLFLGHSERQSCYLRVESVGSCPQLHPHSYQHSFLRQRSASKEIYVFN